MLPLCLHKVTYSTERDPFRVHVHVNELISVSGLGKISM